MNHSIILCLHEERTLVCGIYVFSFSTCHVPFCNFHCHFSLNAVVTGKSEELLESSESYHPAEPAGQKILLDHQPGSGNPSKAAVPPPSQWDCKKKAEPCGDAAEFPPGLPADLEEQRQFLTEQCIAAFCLCLSRFPQHYKSLYRLAYLYTYSKTHKVSRPLTQQLMSCLYCPSKQTLVSFFLS